MSHQLDVELGRGSLGRLKPWIIRVGLAVKLVFPRWGAWLYSGNLTYGCISVRSRTGRFIRPTMISLGISPATVDLIGIVVRPSVRSQSACSEECALQMWLICLRDV